MYVRHVKVFFGKNFDKHAKMLNSLNCYTVKHELYIFHVRLSVRLVSRRHLVAIK